MLTTELQDLRASYAGLLLSTETIRERLNAEEESRQDVAKALTPFPAAFAEIENLHTRQEEASEILTTIKQRVEVTADREKSLLTTMDSVHGGVGKLQSGMDGVYSEVKDISVAVSEMSTVQASARTSLQDFGKRMDTKFEEAAETARENSQRLENSSEDVVQVLQKMERNSQRSLWVFAIVLAILFIALVSFSAKLSQLGSSGAASSESLVNESPAQEAVGTALVGVEVLSDELEF